MFLKEIFPESKTRYQDIVEKYSVVNYKEGLRMRDRVEMFCCDCQHTFIQRANNIFSQGIISCKCSKFYRKSEEELLLSAQESCSSKYLQFTSIEYTKPLTKSIVTFKCNTCLKVSSSSYENIVHMGVGCTHCSGKYRASREEYASKLQSIFLDSFVLCKPLPEKVSNKTTVSVRCCTCGTVAAKTIAAIIYHKASCHCFANYGYDKTKPGYLYLISLTKDTETFYKIGITCDTRRRFRELSNMNKLEINVLCIWGYPANSVILEHESFLKNHFGLGRSEEKPFEYGYTESVRKDSLPVLICLQNLQYKLV